MCEKLVCNLWHYFLVNCFFIRNELPFYDISRWFFLFTITWHPSSINTWWVKQCVPSYIQRFTQSPFIVFISIYPHEEKRSMTIEIFFSKHSLLTISWGTDISTYCLSIFSYSIELVTSTNFSRNRTHWHTDEHDANDIHDLFEIFSMYYVYLSIKVVVSILQTTRQFVLKHCGTNAFARCPLLHPIIRVSNKFSPSRIRHKNRCIDSDDERTKNFFHF